MSSTAGHATRPAVPRRHSAPALRPPAFGMPPNLSGMDSVGQTTLADLSDEAFQRRDALADPVEFFGRDRIVRRISRVHISLAEKFEASAREFIGAWPCSDEFGRDLLSMAAQEVQAVRFGTIEGEDELSAMVCTLRSLVICERGVEMFSVFQISCRTATRASDFRKPLIEVLLSFDFRFGGRQLSGTGERVAFSLIESDTLLGDIDEKRFAAFEAVIEVR